VHLPGYRKSMRRLVVGDATYLWRVSHRHHVVELEGGGRRGCQEVFSAYLDGHPRAPLRVVFSDSLAGGREPIERAGVVAARGDPDQVVNLHEPAVARALVDLALARGWNPRTARRAFVIENGFEILEALLVPTNAR
jgi:hypothetical protein